MSALIRTVALLLVGRLLVVLGAIGFLFRSLGESTCPNRSEQESDWTTEAVPVAIGMLIGLSKPWPTGLPKDPVSFL